MSTEICEICPHHCRLANGQTGFCNARGNVNGEIIALNYGEITALALDPIEKKPLKQFLPGSMILSVGSYGCNLRCPFCQNHDISMSDNRAGIQRLEPEALVDIAESLRSKGNIGIAFTYNEPLVGYEYVYDTAKLAKQQGLKTVLVTNGYCCEGSLTRLFEYIDAVNIDLKAFTDTFYRKIKGDLQTVKTAIKTAASLVHLEVTTLIIPKENDSDDEIISLTKWLASISKDIPLHLSRFFPQYRMTDRPATDRKRIDKLAELAAREMYHVYLGNY